MRNVALASILLFLILIFPFSLHSAKQAPTTQVFNPWCHTFNKPYADLFDKTVASLITDRQLDIFDFSKEDHFIYGVVRGSPYVDTSIRFKEEGKGATKVIVRCPSSKSSRAILRLIGDAVGEPLPTKPPRIKHRESLRDKMTYSKEDMDKECKPYMEYMEEE